MQRNPRDLVRYTASERANHWIVGICFILLALSGLAFFHPAFFCKKAADDIISIFLRVLCCKVHKPNFDCMFNVQTHFQHQMPQVHIQSRQLLQICKIQILVHSLPLAFYAFFVVCAVGCKLHVIIIILQKIHCFFFRSLPECDAFFFHVLNQLFGRKHWLHSAFSSSLSFSIRTKGAIALVSPWRTME